jgi:PPP family 3-phenylpropionic acid transporter
MALFYSAIFVVLGVSLPYFPLWLKGRGLSAFEIGLVTSVPLFVRIIATPAIGIAADRRQSVREIVVLAGIVGLLSACALMVSHGVLLIMLLFTVFQISSMAMMPLAEVAAMQGVRDKGLDYGRMRVWGSVSFIAANIGGGWIIATSGNWTILPILIFGSALALLAGWFLPDGRKTSEAARKYNWRDMREALGQRGLPLIMLAGGTIQAAHAVYYAFSAIHWQAQGIDGRWFGFLWGVGVVAEVVLFIYAGHVLRRIGAIAMMGIGAAGSVLRWGLMAIDPSFGVLVGLQLLHGLTFGATHLGTVHAIQERVRPDQAASAQAMHSALSSGILMGLTMMLAGVLYGSLQGLSYVAMMVLSLVGWALVGWAAVKQRRQT